MRPGYVIEIARFTLHEAVSRRLILAGVLISLAYLGLFALGFHFAYDKALETAQTTEARLALGYVFALLTLFGVYVVNYLASFLALFLSVGAISGEVDAGTLHAVLARPIGRAEFIIGRWLGYAVMLGVYIVAMTGMVLLIARGVAGYEVPDPVPALLLMLLEGLVLLSLSLLGSCVMSTMANGVVAFTLLGLAWLAGVIESVGTLLRAASNASGSDAMINIGIAVSLVLPSDALWRGASFYLESPALAGALNTTRGVPLFSGAPPAPALVVWALAYAVVALVSAVFVFRARDL